MLGLVSYRDAGEKNGARTLCGVRFCAVYIARGEGMAARLSARRAAKYLKWHRVRYAVFPKDYPCKSAFARFGILPPSDWALRQAKAAEIVRCAMAQRGLRPECARIALLSAAPSAALEAAARELARDVRYLSLCTPGQDRIARSLRWDCGASVYEVQRGDHLASDLAVCFDDVAPPFGAVLPLAEALLKVEYGAAEIEDAAPDWDQNQLICALYAALVRRADEIWVKDVKFLPKAGETANLP